jgi:hypothetical protein
MADKEYEKFYNQKVGVITIGRLTNFSPVEYVHDTNNKNNTGDSLLLEGILTQETDTQIFLKNLKTVQESNGQFDVDSLCGYISKDKIISLYLIGKWVKKVEKKKVEKESELIGGQEPPKPDSAKSE